MPRSSPAELEAPDSIVCRTPLGHCEKRWTSNHRHRLASAIERGSRSGENVVEGLAKLGFSRCEARAYLTLLRESPVTGYKLAKLSGIPPSAIHEVGSRLVARGAAMILRMESTDKHAPVPAIGLLEQLRREYGRLVASRKEELAGLNSVPEPKPVWNIEGRESITAKTKEMIDRANNHIYLAPSPAAFPALQPSLGTAIRRGARVVTASMIEPAPRRIEGPCLLLVVDGEEVLIGERLAGNRAWALWTRSSPFVLLAQRYLRTDLYLPRMLTLLGDRARDLVLEEILDD